MTIRRRYGERADGWHLAILLIAACSSLILCGRPCRADSWDQKVFCFGEMREVLGKGDHRGRVELQTLLKKPHCFAVGALADLAGEVTIVDGEIVATRVDENGHPVLASSGNEAARLEATMLAGGYVTSWSKQTLDEAVKGDALEKALADKARAAGLDISKPFPFMVVGELTEMVVHVINGECPMRAMRLGKKIPDDKKPFRMAVPKTKATIVGVYAEDGEHRLTHHGTKMHMHLLIKDADGKRYTGHIERAGLSAGAVIRVPEKKDQVMN